MEHDKIRAIRWDGETLELLDQRRLPEIERYLPYTSSAGVASAISDMVVRGAPAIGVTAAYGVVLAAKSLVAKYPDSWTQKLAQEMKHLAAARPTAINLYWALERMQMVIDTLDADTDPVARLHHEAVAIHSEDITANQRMGELGAGLIESGKAVLTHCNTGSLATGGYGTALGVIRSAYSQKRITSVFADETRPWMQGARLTAWELVHDGIPVKLIVEGAASALLATGQIGWVIVGSDRIAANGDVANKIGTYGLAVLAKHHGVKFMVAAPTSTIDMNTASGELIPIESRSENEVLSWHDRRVAASGAGAWNPVFDVTPAALVDAIVTERGIVETPTAQKMAELMSA